MARTTLKADEKTILNLAKERGVESNYFFRTTFQRYKTQLAIMEQLEKTIRESETLVTKEYVKGRQNVVANPAITEYNRTATAANQTVSTLIKIIKDVAAEQQSGGTLQDMIAGLDNE